MTFKLNFRFNLEENFVYPERPEHFFLAKYCVSGESVYFAQAAKKSEVSYSTWVIIEHYDKDIYILRIPGLDLIYSIPKSDKFVVLFSTYVCFKKIKNFVEQSRVNQSMQ